MTRLVSPHYHLLLVQALINGYVCLSAVPREFETTRQNDLESSSTSNCGRSWRDLRLGDSGRISSREDLPEGAEEGEEDVTCLWKWEVRGEDAIVMTSDETKVALTQGPEESNILLSCSGPTLPECLPFAETRQHLMVNPNPPENAYYVICQDFSGTELRSVSNEAWLAFRSVDGGDGGESTAISFDCEWEVVESAAAEEATTEEQEAAVRRGYNGEKGCGVRPSPDGDDDEVPATSSALQRIVGGEEAVPHEFPWLVGLYFNKEWFCGGSLISREWVLTAGHCVQDAESAFVFLGVHNLFEQEAGQVIMYSEVFRQHPKFVGNLATLKFDLGLVKLPRIVTYSDTIRPTCLPLKSSGADDSLEGRDMVTAGWGLTENGSGEISDLLNKATLVAVSNRECKRSFGEQEITDTILCARNDGRGGGGGAGTCQGDSGGTLQYESDGGAWVQVGVVSFGPDDGCGSRHPNGYSRISHLLDFVQNVTHIEYY